MKREHVGMLETVRESAHKDGRGVHRVMFLGFNAQERFVPLTSLKVYTTVSGPKSVLYREPDMTRWPEEFVPNSARMVTPLYFCQVPVGEVDSVAYLGTLKIRQVGYKPVAANTPGAKDFGRVHCLYSKDPERAETFNTLKYTAHYMQLRDAQRMFASEEELASEFGYNPEPTRQVFLPDIYAPRKTQGSDRWTLRRDRHDAVRIATAYLEAARNFTTQNTVSPAGASVLLAVCECASRDNWGYEFKVDAPGLYRVRLDAAGQQYMERAIELSKNDPAYGVDGDDQIIQHGGRWYQFFDTKVYNPSYELTAQIMKKFNNVPEDIEVVLVPTVGEEWTRMTEGKTLWRPEGLESREYNPEELTKLPNYQALCYLAVLAGKQVHEAYDFVDYKLAYSRSTPIVDLKTEGFCQVQRVKSSPFALYSKMAGIEANLGEFDFLAKLTRGLSKTWIKRKNRPAPAPAAESAV